MCTEVIVQGLRFPNWLLTSVCTQTSRQSWFQRQCPVLALLRISIISSSTPIPSHFLHWAWPLFWGWGGGPYCHLCRLYAHRVDRMQECFDLHHKCFLAAPLRQANRFHFLTVLQKMHFTHEAICLQWDFWKEIQNGTCTVYVHWPAGMKEEWILINTLINDQNCRSASIFWLSSRSQKQSDAWR